MGAILYLKNTRTNIEKRIMFTTLKYKFNLWISSFQFLAKKKHFLLLQLIILSLISYYNMIFYSFWNYLRASCAFLECYHQLQDIIVINSPLVKFPFKCSNPAVFGDI